MPAAISPRSPAPLSPTKTFDRSKVLLSDEDINEFREIFNLIDSDKSGCISTDELKQLVESVGMKLTDEEFEEMTKELDGDGSGEVDFEEFLVTMSRGANSQYSAEDIRTAFQTFARNAPPGLIRMRDLYEGLTVYLKNKDVNHNDINNLMKQFEDSVITLPGVYDTEGIPVRFFKYDEYINLMMSASQPTPIPGPKPELKKGATKKLKAKDTADGDGEGE